MRAIWPVCARLDPPPTPATRREPIEAAMRKELTRGRLRAFMQELCARAEEIPESAHANYPSRSRSAVVQAVVEFLADAG